MSQKQWTAVDRYISDLFVPPDSALDAALGASRKAQLPEIQVAPNQGKLLMILARIRRARRILEIGTLGGYSTIWLARALPDDGRLVTLEADPKHAEVARANIAAAGLTAKVDVRLGPAIETLPKIEAERIAPFDFIFIDADKEGYADYLTWSLKLSRAGTVIVADNVVRDGEVADSRSKDANVRGVRRFNAMLAAEPRVTATVVQVVGTKGYDGLAIGIVTGGA